MEPVISTIALSVLGNLATDLVRWSAKQKVDAIQDAIDSTTDTFTAIEGLSKTLSEWLTNPRVLDVLSTFVQGQIGPAEVPIQDLASALINQTQFYLPGHATPTAEKIILRFISKLRAAYLANHQTSGLYIANRQEVQFGIVNQQLAEIRNEIRSVNNPTSLFARRFDSAVAELNGGNVLIARSMLESLLEDLRSAPLRSGDLERSVHAKLGVSLSLLDDRTQAAYHLRAAAEFEKEDPARGTANSAAADMLEEKYEQALAKLENVQLNDENDNFYYWHSKVMALVGLQRFDEALAIAKRTDIGGTAAARSNLIGTVYLHARRYDEAAIEYQIAAETDGQSAESYFGTGEMLLFPLVALQNQDQFGRVHPPQFSEKLERAAGYLRKAAALFRAKGRSTAATHADEKLALAYCLQEKFSEAIHLLEPIVQDTIEGRQNLVNLGFAYLAADQPSKAVAAFRRALAIECDANTERAYVQVLVGIGQTQQALDYLRPRITQAVTENTLHLHLGLANVHCARREYSLAKKILDDLRRNFSEKAEVLLAEAELHQATSNFPAALTAYHAALKNAVGRLETRVRFQFGRFCFGQKDFAQAAAIWKPMMRLGGSPQLRDWYVIALYNSREYEEVIRISEEMRLSGTEVSDVFADVASAANEQLSNLQIARYWLEYSCDHYGNKPDLVLRLAQIELRLGRREKAVELLDATKSALKNEPHDLLNFAKSYSLLGKPEESLDLAFKAAQIEKSAEIYSGYISAFLAATQDGKVKPTPEQIAFYQDAISNFNVYFPDAKQVQSIHIDPDNPLEAIREVLTKHSEQVQRAIDIFKKNRLPLTALAKVLGRDMFEVWRQCLGNQDLSLISALGTEDEGIQFQQSLSNASGLMIDLVALFTLTELRLLDKLKDFGDIYVAQAVLDYLHYMQSARMMGTPAGTIGMVQGEFFMTQISPEDVAKTNAQLDEATEWIERSAGIVGFKKVLTQEETEWSKLLGDATLATLAITKQRSVLLLSDDKALRDVAKLTHGISSINTQALLLYLVNKGTLSRGEYDAAVIKLVEMGYTFTRVEEEQFFSVLDREDFVITPAVALLFGVLESPTLDLKSGCSVVASLLRRLYSEIIPAGIKENSGVYMLNCLIKNHPQEKENIRLAVATLLQEHIGSQAPLRVRSVFELLLNW